MLFACRKAVAARGGMRPARGASPGTGRCRVDPLVLMPPDMNGGGIELISLKVSDFFAPVVAGEYWVRRA